MSKPPYIHAFTSFTEFTDYAATTPIARQWKAKNYATSGDTGREHYCGPYSWEQTLDLARSGWPQGAARIEQYQGALDALIQVRQTRKPARDLALTGMYPDVAEYLGGNPEHFVRRTLRTRRRTVRVVVGCAHASHVSADSLTYNGLAACAFVDRLEASGVRVELIVECTVRPEAYLAQSPEFYQWLVPLKQYGNVMDRDAVVFALAHPCFLRRLMFRAMETIGTAARALTRGHGYCAGYTPEADDVYIPWLHCDLANLADAMQRLDRIVAEGQPT